MNILKMLFKKRISESEYHAMMYRLILSYTIFLAVCLLLITYLYRSSMKNSESEYWEQNKSVFQSSLSLMDNQFIIIDSYCRQLIQDTNFTSTVLMKNNDQHNFYINAYRSKRSLPSQLYSYSQLPIDYFYIYLKNYDYILSVNKFEKADLYYLNTMKDPVWGMEEWKEKITTANSRGSFYIKEQEENGTFEKTYSYLVDLSAITYKQMPATVCFRFHSAELKGIFSNLQLNNSGYLLITDQQNNEIISFSDSAQANIDVAKLTGLNYNGSYADFNNDSESFHVTKLTSSFNDWNYYLIQPFSIYQASSGIYRIVFVIFMILLAAVSLLLILQLSRKHMKPVLLLSNRLHETINAHNELKEMVDFQKPYICSSYLRHLLLGNVSNDQEINYIQNYLQLNDNDLNYVVFYIVYYNTNDTAYDYTEDKINEIVKEALLEEFSNYTIPHLYSPDERSYSLLLYAKGQTDDMLIALQEKFIRLHELLLEQYSIWIFTGVGLCCNSLQHIWKSYQQAKDMISYSSKNYIFLLYEMKERDSDSFYYPEELSTKMFHFITKANQMQVTELFQLIHTENFAKRALPANILSFLLTDIRNTLIKIRFSITAPEKKAKKLLQELDSQFDKPLTFQLCETIALNLCEIFALHNESNDLINNMVNYIKENYNDPSLGLNKISAEFHISESYFSHMFKENTGTNFSVYLENIRLRKALHLIKETDVNVSDLYLQVGYNSASTFRRAFKKKFQVTPSSIKNTN